MSIAPTVRNVRSEMARLGEILATSPGIGQLFEDAAYPGARRLRLQGTPYHVYYLLDEATQIVWVIRVWSGAHAEGPNLNVPR